MKPIKLVLKYIGPHLNTTIDFEKLDDFFLISGETGAGKTFIFDSIINSIYGEPKQESYEERDKSLVSSLKPPLEVPSIEYTFGIGAATYRVFRTLSYQKPTKKTKENATARLEMLDSNTGSFIQLENDVKAVNERLEKLIGLSKNEFKKIVILPQGEFQKFLKMTPGDKKKFLIEVFKDTQIFSTVKKNVRSDFSNLNKEIKTLNEALERRISETNYENGEKQLKEYKIRFKELSENKKSLTSKQNELSGLLAEAKAVLQESREYSTNQTKKEDLKKQKPEIESKRNRLSLCKEAEKINLPYTTWKNILKDSENAEKDLNSLLSQLENSTRKLESLTERKTEIDVQKESVIQNEKELELISKQLTKIEEVETSQKKKEEWEKIYETARQTAKELDSSRQRILNELFKISGCTDSTPEKMMLKFTEEINAAEKDRDSLLLQKEAAIKNESLEKKIRILEQQFIEEKKKLETQEIQKKNLKEIKEKNYAYFLALNLKENTPCPVCGSLTHPAKASKPDFSKCKELVETTLEQALLDAENIYSEINKSVTAISTKLDQNRKQLEENKLESTLAEIETSLNSTLEKITVLEKSKNECKKIQENLESIKKDIESAQEKESEAQTEYNRYKTEHATIIKENFDNKDVNKAALQDKHSDLETENKKLSESITDWENEYNKVSTENTNLIGQKKIMESHAAELKDKKLNAEKSFMEALSKSVFKTEEEIENSFLEESKKNILEKEIKEWETNLQEVTIKLENSKTTMNPQEAQKNFDEINTQLESAKKQNEEIENELRSITEKRASLESNMLDIQKREKEIAERRERLIPLDLLNRHLSGTPEIDTWATKLYFTNILAFANNRFKEITNNTYEFIFGSADKEGIAEDELDISVVESATNITRHSSSLSGGEEFLASISLALGLADAIQCQHSNAQIESMFIDEGFGTLGIEVQNKAVEVLRKLNDTRKIGIISHSENIETEIDSRLKVTKENGVSTVTHYLRDIAI